MSRNTSRIDVHFTSDSVNSILPPLEIQSQTDKNTEFYGPVHTVWFNQGEDQFIQLKKSIEVPAFPIHHEINNYQPPENYEKNLCIICEQCVSQFPALFAGTTWFFDPASILSPSFYRIESVEGTPYVYICRIDLSARPLEIEIQEQGSNNRTHSYRTNRLYVECDWFPLAGQTKDSLKITASIPATWKGEAGQGYMIHGIWMDSDINKFFSKLVLPAGIRNHPFYPLTCKRHCISMNAFGHNGPEFLHKSREFIEPALEEILAFLNNYPFSELAPLFTAIKSRIPQNLISRWKNLTVKPYLNDQDNKEYQIDFYPSTI